MERVEVINQQVVLGQDFKMYGTVDNPLFLAKDVAEWIEHSHLTTMLKNVDYEEKLSEVIVHAGQRREMMFLTEDGLYEVLMQSRKPIAKKFKKEVKRILKDIRKNGMYATDELLDNPDLLIRVATELKKEKEARLLAEGKLEEQQPQVIFAKSVETSRNAVSVKTLATILKQNDIDIGQNRLFVWLRQNGYLSSRKGKSWNMPTQRSMDMKLFELKPNTFFHNGIPETDYTPLVTGKGQVYFINKFSEELQLV